MEPISLLVRSLFKDDKSDNSTDSDHTCPVENTSGPTIQPFVGGLTYHQFSVILSGACAILSTFIIAAAIIRHSINYSNPVQQRQIIRILLLAPYICLFSFLVVWRDDIGDYLLESLDFGCSIALSSFLLFMCDLVLSHRGGFDDLFGDGAYTRGAFAGNSPPKLRRVWYSVLQFFPVSVVVWVATAISLAVGTYCKQSNSVHFAHIWLQVISIVSATVAIINSIRFYGMHKTKLLQHRILLKLFTFKGIIGLNAMQTFIISILAGQNILKPSKYMSYHDINTGLASFILSCEMPLFAILLFFAFPTSPYKSQSPAATSLSAIVDALNITDLLSAFVRGPMRLVRDQQRQILRQDSVKIGIDELAVDSDHEGRRNAARLTSTV